jgi:hypothetical protein
MSKSNQEICNVGVSTFEVLCCTISVDNTVFNDHDLLEDVNREPVSTQDIIIEEFKDEMVVEICLQMNNTQMFPKAMKLLADPNIWIGDTGASVDVTPVAEGLTDSRPCNISLHVGNNEHTAATHNG